MMWENKRPIGQRNPCCPICGYPENSPNQVISPFFIGDQKCRIGKLRTFQEQLDIVRQEMARRGI